MIRHLLLGTAAFVWFCHPAAALEEPRPCPGGDGRMRCVAPSPNQVVLLRSHPGASLVIEVPEGEKVLAVPVSDNALMTHGAAKARLVSDDGGATVDGNLSVAVRGTTVVVKPHGKLEPQPFFVVTEREGHQRQYAFELRSEDDEAMPYYYSVRVRNVAAEQQARQARAAERQRVRETQVARDRLVQAQAAPCDSIANVNLRYAAQGDPALAPSVVCDDGRSTYLRFPGVQRMPAVFSILPDGREAAVNVSTGPDGWITVHEHSPQLRLRDGGRVLCLINRGYTLAGTNTETGTVSPEVVRTSVEAPR
jgi:type IV secretion system protein VirB9